MYGGRWHKRCPCPGSVESGGCGCLRGCLGLSSHHGGCGPSQRKPLPTRELLKTLQRNLQSHPLVSPNSARSSTCMYPRKTTHEPAAVCTPQARTHAHRGMTSCTPRIPPHRGIEIGRERKSERERERGRARESNQPSDIHPCLWVPVYTCLAMYTCLCTVSFQKGVAASS